MEVLVEVGGQNIPAPCGHVGIAVLDLVDGGGGDDAANGTAGAGNTPPEDPS